MGDELSQRGTGWPLPETSQTKPSKLTSAQKAEILSWLDAGKTAHGEYIHWTLERLRYAISEAFGVTLGINTIWVWLRKENLKLKVPRPQHYKADKQAQEALKKLFTQVEDNPDVAVFFRPANP